MASCPQKYDLKRRSWSLSHRKIRDLFMFFEVSANGKLLYTERATFLWTFSTFSHRHSENKLGLRRKKNDRIKEFCHIPSELRIKLSRFLAEYCYEVLNFAGAINYATFKMILHETFDIFRWIYFIFSSTRRIPSLVPRIFWWSLEKIHAVFRVCGEKEGKYLDEYVRQTSGVCWLTSTTPVGQSSPCKPERKRCTLWEKSTKNNVKIVTNATIFC